MPFPGLSSGLIFDGILNRTPASAAQLNPDVPPELEQIVGKCLEKDRDLRYQHASEIRADLQRLKRDRESGRLPSSPQADTRAGLPSRRRSTLWLSAAVIVIASAVAGWFYLRRPPTLTDKDTIVLADFINTTGDPVFDRDASTRTRGTTRAVAISQHRPRRPHPPSAAADGPAANGAVDRRCGARHLRAHWQHRGRRGIDCEPRHAVRPRPARAELRDRRSARPGTTPGSAERRRAERPQPARDAIQDTRRRIAGDRAAALDTARGVQHRLARRAEGVQRCVSRDRHANGDPAAQTRRRDRSRFRDCAFAAGPAVQHPRRDRPRRREHPQSIRAARSRDRPRSLLHHDDL